MYVNEANIFIDDLNGTVTFVDLLIDKPGMYLLNITIGTNDFEYNFWCTTKLILVKNSLKFINLDDEEEPNFYLKFNASFNNYAYELDHFKSIIYNCLIEEYNLTLIRKLSIYEGSIMVNMGLEEESPTNVAMMMKFLQKGFNLTRNFDLVDINLYDEQYVVEKTFYGNIDELSDNIIYTTNGNNIYLENQAVTNQKVYIFLANQI